jgi:hypothetical protein
MRLISTANGHRFTQYDLPAQSDWTEHLSPPLKTSPHAPALDMSIPRRTSSTQERLRTTARLSRACKTR